MLVILYEMGQMCFRVIGTSNFYVKTENERFTAAFRQKLKFEIFTSSFCTLRQRNVLKCVSHGHAARLCFFIRSIILWIRCRRRRLLNSPL